MRTRLTGMGCSAHLPIIFQKALSLHAELKDIWGCFARFIHAVEGGFPTSAVSRTQTEVTGGIHVRLYAIMNRGGSVLHDHLQANSEQTRSSSSTVLISPQHRLVGFDNRKLTHDTFLSVENMIGIFCV